MTQMQKRLNNKTTYPDSDGKPMAENTEQFNYIVLIKEGIEDLLADNPEVFVAGDLLWYPVEGRPDINVAPDTMVAFGRPKGFRSSYMQWVEKNVAPQVVFEVWSHSNRSKEKENKLKFYEQYNVEEYYAYDPLKGELEGWQRQNDRLEKLETMQGWISPLLKIKFELTGKELKLYRPDEQVFVSYSQMAERARQAELHRLRAEQRAEQEQAARQEAEAQAQQNRLEFEQLLAKLREKGINPDNL